MAVGAGILGSSSVSHRNIHPLDLFMAFWKTEREELMPKKDKDVSIAMFLTELKDQKLLGMMASPKHFGGGFQTQVKFGIYSVFWASLGYIGRLYLTDKKKREEIFFFKKINI